MFEKIIKKFIGCIEKEQYKRVLYLYKSLRKVAIKTNSTATKMSELNFLLCDLMHDEKNILKLSPEYIASLFTRARMLNGYANGYTEKAPEEILELIDFLKTNTWTKVYGSTYEEFKKWKD